MEEELKNIIIRLDRMEKILNRLDKHISFINNVYDSVETPLMYIKQKFNMMNITKEPRNKIEK
jgi:hypothetical protein